MNNKEVRLINANEAIEALEQVKCHIDGDYDLKYKDIVSEVLEEAIDTIYNTYTYEDEEPEPRILTVDELLDESEINSETGPVDFSERAIWLEIRDMGLYAAIMMLPKNAEDMKTVTTICVDNLGGMEREIKYYGKTWRVWNKRPDKEFMEGEDWQCL